MLNNPQYFLAPVARRRAALRLTALIVFFAALISCSKKTASYAAFEQSPVASYAADESSYVEASRAKTEDYSESAILQDAAVRKFVTTSSLEIRSENLTEGVNAVTALLTKYNSYTATVNIYENSRRWTLKIPAAHLQAFTKELMTIGRVIHYSENTEDVTYRYYDLENRLATKKELLKTYQSYLVKAQNIEEILAVESRIADLQAEIDNTGSQFRMLGNLIDYSTVQLELLGPVASSSYGRQTIGERVKELFAGFGGFASTVLIILLGFVFYGIPSIIILFFLYWIFLGKIGLLKKLFRLVSAKKKIIVNQNGHTES